MASPFDLAPPQVGRVFLPAVKWEPDQIGDGISNILDAKNVWPHPAGYQTIERYGTVDSSTNAPASQVYTGISLIAYAGDPYVYVSTASKLHRYKPLNAYSDLTGAVTAGPWSLTRYANLVVATSQGGVAQKQTISGAGAFANLGGSPPQMQYACVVRDFLVFARSAANPNRVQWSALGDPENWTVSAATQADFQDIPDEGPVEFIVGGEYGLIFFRNAIYRMSYIGSPVIFQFDKIASGMGVAAIMGGTGSYNQAARLGDNVYFNCQEGLAVVAGGQVVRSLFTSRCAKYFDASTARLDYKAEVTVDALRKMAVLGYSSIGLGSTTQMDRLIFYSETLDRLSRAEVTMECLFQSIVGAFVTSRYKAVETMTFYDASHRHNTLSTTVDAGASNLTPIVDTEERQLFPGRRAIVREALPNVEPQDVLTVAIGSRAKLGDSISRTSAQAIGANGWARFRKEGRYHSARISTSGNGADGGKIIRGADVEAIMQGER